MKELLKSHELKKESTKGFKHHPSPLNQNENKLEGFVKVIIEYSLIANNSRGDFEDLIISTCVSRSVMVKAGLKLNPNKPNEKSLLRIQEKMLFKNAVYTPPLCSSLKCIKLRKRPTLIIWKGYSNRNLKSTLKYRTWFGGSAPMQPWKISLIRSPK